MSSRNLVFALLAFVAAASVAVIVRAPHQAEARPVGIRESLWRQFESNPAEPTEQPNILIITIDALRADHMSLYGYSRPTTPRIDEFFGDTRVFDRAYSPAGSTTPSLVGMLTGLYPHHHGVRLLCQKIRKPTLTITDHVRRVGYQTAAVVSNAVLADVATGLGEKFDHYDDDVDEQEAHREDMFERRASRTTDAAITWLDGQRDPNKPHLLWVHYIDPHGPYRPPADAPVRFSHEGEVPVIPERIPTCSREPDVHDGLEYVDRYDEEIAYTDREVGRLLDHYRQTGLLEDAVIILTADHGEYMMEIEHWFTHGFYVYEPTLRVPLAIRASGVPAGREITPVSIIDVTPTILALLGLPVHDQLDGINLAGTIHRRPIHVEGRDSRGDFWRGLIDGYRKVVVRHGRSNVVREALVFDLSTDPQEQRPQPADSSDALYSSLQEIVANDPDRGGVPVEYVEGELPGPNVANGASERMMNALEALGYIERPPGR